MTTQALLPGMPVDDIGDERDHWQTPAWAVNVILPFLPTPRSRGFHLLEPSAGRGAILRAAVPILLPESWSAFEIDGGRFKELSETRDALQQHTPDSAVHRVDFLTCEVHIPKGVPLLVLGNPPYSLATEFVERCIKLANEPIEPHGKGAVAMLLQHDFAAGVDRAERIHDRWSSSIYPLRRRPKFGKNATGERPFTWFVWDLANPKREWRCL